MNEMNSKFEFLLLNLKNYMLQNTHHKHTAVYHPCSDGGIVTYYAMLQLVA